VRVDPVLGGALGEVGVGEVAVLGGTGSRGLRGEPVDNGGQDAVKVQGQGGVVRVAVAGVVAEDLGPGVEPDQGREGVLGAGRAVQDHLQLSPVVPGMRRLSIVTRGSGGVTGRWRQAMPVRAECSSWW
jgi:hypothetical protein